MKVRAAVQSEKINQHLQINQNLKCWYKAIYKARINPGRQDYSGVKTP